MFRAAVVARKETAFALAISADPGHRAANSSQRMLCREVSMREKLRALPIAVTLIVGTATGAVSAERRSELLRYSDVQIEVVAEGAGPAVVLLPSLARDSDDYD